MTLLACEERVYHASCACSFVAPSPLREAEAWELPPELHGLSDLGESVVLGDLETDGWVVLVATADPSSDQRRAEAHLPGRLRPGTGSGPYTPLLGVLGGNPASVAWSSDEAAGLTWRATAAHGQARSWLLVEQAPTDEWDTWAAHVAPFLDSLDIRSVEQDPPPLPARVGGRPALAEAVGDAPDGSGCSGPPPEAFVADGGGWTHLPRQPDVPAVVYLHAQPRAELLTARDGVGGRGPAPFVEAGFAVVVPCSGGGLAARVDDAVAAAGRAASLPGVDPARVYFVGDGSATEVLVRASSASAAHRASILVGGLPWWVTAGPDEAPVSVTNALVRPLVWLAPELDLGGSIDTSMRTPVRRVVVPRDDGATSLRGVFVDVARKMGDDRGPSVRIGPGPVALHEAGVASLQASLSAFDVAFADWGRRVLNVGLLGEHDLAAEARVVFPAIPGPMLEQAWQGWWSTSGVERLQLEASWPIVDGDRVGRAFDTLRAEGWAAFEGTVACAGCVPDQVLDAAEALGGAPYVYYEWFEAERALEEGVLYVAYGAADGAPTGAQGERVVGTLRAEGLHPIWSGDPSYRVAVPVEWKRRMPVPVPVEEPVALE